MARITGKHPEAPSTYRPCPPYRHKESHPFKIHKSYNLYDFEMSGQAELIRGATLVGSGQGGGQGPCACPRARTRIDKKRKTTHPHVLAGST